MRQPGPLMRLSDKGFTLPELLLAAIILALVLSGLLMLFINCIFLNESNRNLTTATTHAEYIMEQIRGAGFIGLEDRIGANEWDLNAVEIQSPPYNLTPLTNETITTTAVLPSGNPFGVSVKVNWRDRTHRDRETELQSLITDY
jgi:prepilin-type N-terminal cleavage/methylation domain-containing protein